MPNPEFVEQTFAKRKSREEIMKELEDEGYAVVGFFGVKEGEDHRGRYCQSNLAMVSEYPEQYKYFLELIQAVAQQQLDRIGSEKVQ